MPIAAPPAALPSPERSPHAVEPIAHVAVAAPQPPPAGAPVAPPAPLVLEPIAVPETVAPAAAPELPLLPPPPTAQPSVRLPKRIPAKRKSFIAALDTPMIWLSRNDALTLRDLVSGVHVTGGNGSGKTSASGATLARAFLKGGFGGLVCTVKHDELQTWQRYARETGRAQHLIVVSEDGPWRFNFLQYELARNAPLTTRIENVVSILVNVMTQSGNRSGGNNEYWYNQAERLLGSAIGILAAARPRFTLMDLMRFIFEAPTDRETIRSDEWPSHPFAIILKEARTAYLAEGKEQDYRAREEYWLNNFISLPVETRGSIISTLDMMINKLTTGTVREIFNTECNFFPEDTWEGAVIVLALPAAENDAFAFAQVLFKIAWQQAALRRMKDVDPKTSRPLFLFCDESHLLVAPFDTKFQSLIRAGKVCTVYMTQNLNAYYQRLPGSDPKATAKALLSYFQNQWFHANGDPETNQYAIELFGKTDYEQVTSTRGGTRTDQRGKAAKPGKDATEPEDSTNLSSSESDAVMLTIRDAVRPEEISALRTGGPHNRYRVGALVYRTGRIWKSSKALRLTVEFDQRAK